jgi:anti-sigma factor RsiW
MLFLNKKENCRNIRDMLADAVGRRFDGISNRLQKHIANCPRCRRRLAGYNRVSLAMFLMKTQPHRLDLLTRANSQAIKYLKNKLKESPRAEVLRQMQPGPSWLQRCGRYTHSIGQAAACFAALLLMRIGIFSSIDKFQSEGEKVVRQYYSRNLGEDNPLMDELFRT